ncbi:MAG: DUF1801 domain-containing protein [Bacteroidetes bacterium]|nr:DUF1801 domain-containing protein [Bacteroidota bacterium]
MQTSSLVETVEQYCNQYPAPIRKRLAAIRRLVKELAPEATEKISYRMPYYALNGRLVYFAAHTHHIGVYPMPSAIKKFQSKLQPYVYAAGSIQFPHTAPFPLELIRAIIAFRVKENREKASKVSAKNARTAR